MEELPNLSKNIIIISGPSGAGEDTIIQELSKIVPVQKIVTTTTRSPRDSEQDGIDYHFISKQEFQDRLGKGEFVEWAQHYNGNYYGVSKQELDKVARSGKLGIWKVEHQGVKAIKKMFPEMLAFLIWADEDEILRRLSSRGDMSESQIKERMEYTRDWDKSLYDYVIYNHDGKLEEAVKQLTDILYRKGLIKN